MNERTDGGSAPANSRVSALLAALRISRRDAWRAKGRSALIIAMVGLPVLVITALLTALSTMAISPQESLTATLGTADALVRDQGRQPIHDQDYAARGFSSGGGADVRPWTTQEITSVLPPGSRAQQLHSRYEPYRLARWWPVVEIMETDLRDPLTRSMFQVVRGRPPAAPDEVAVPPLLVERGAKIGGTISLTREGTVKKVVGVVERAPWESAEFVVAFPGSGLADQRYQRAWLVDTPDPVTWSGVKKLNALGLVVASRAVIEDPGSAPDDMWTGTGGVDSGSWPALIAMITLMVILEVVLLAGPAFAVGLRRRRTELGLVAAQGGSARHLRMIVLMDGVVLGALSAVLGAVLGISLARALLAMVDRGRGGGWLFEVPWAQVAAVAVLGAASAVIAAVVPASQAARMSVSAVLGGRAAAPRPRRGWPVAGAVLVVAGVGLTVAGAWLGILAIAGGTLITQLGFVALVPRLVGLLGRLSGRLPLPLRLASRDAVRHSGRTAPAVAAVMAGVAVAVALAIPLNSAAIEEKINYQPRQEVGTFEVEGTRLTTEEWQSVRELLRRELPGVTPVEFRGHRRGSSGVFMRLVADDCDSPCVITTRDFPVGDERVLRYVLGREDPAAEAALRAGKMVLLDPRGTNGGQARVETTTYRGESESRQTVTVPAVVAEPAERRSVRAVIPPGLAEKLGMRVEVAMLVVDPREHRVTDAERERIDVRLLEETPSRPTTYLERGFTRDGVFELALLGGAAGLLVLVAAFTATGLAAADARADLAGLAAIGAPAGVRRLFVAGQAGFITASGAVLGVLSGAVPGLVSAWPAGTYSGGAVTSNASPLGYVSDVLSDNTVLDVPWSLLALLVLGLPVLAALVAGAFTRTRVMLTRRTG